LADANINPIPIHTPTGLGGMSDLMTITESSILSFRQWSADYKKKLKLAQVETGTTPFRTVNGHLCHNPIYNMDQYAENKESACGQFLELLGFTDENFSELEGIWDENTVEHIHYKWIPQYGFSEGDFNFFIAMVQGEMSGVDKIIVTHTLLAYNEDDFDEPSRKAEPMINLNYDILKEDYYGLLDEASGPAPEPEGEWEDFNSGTYKRKENYVYSSMSVKFFDAFGTEIIKEDWVIDAITSILTVSMNEAVTHLSVVKISEQEEDNSLIDPLEPWNPTDTVYSVTTEEVVDINFALCTYDRYYIGEDESFYKEEDDHNITSWKPYYVNLLWRAREEVVKSEDPVNNEIGMFEFENGEYFLRVEFEQFANPDEISYLFSSFSYVEVEEEEGGGGFIRGIIGAILFVAGAWLFYHGAKNTTQFLWKMATVVVGLTARKLVASEFEEMYAQMFAEKEAQQKLAMEEAMEEARRNNKVDIGFDYDFWDKYEPSNVFETGSYNPLTDSSFGSNPYTVGGEFWNPHTKLINEREIL